MAKMAKCGEWAIGEFAVLVGEERGSKRKMESVKKWEGGR
jgi:hypothetical protein